MFKRAQKAVKALFHKQKGQISDGFHTFDELYEHRITLYIALCKEYERTDKYPVWKSKKHSDGSVWKDWFILGINYGQGTQITYHLPMTSWLDTNFAIELSKAPEFDGHTSEDVIRLLNNL